MTKYYINTGNNYLYRFSSDNKTELKLWTKHNKWFLSVLHSSATDNNMLFVPITKKKAKLEFPEAFK